MVTIRSTKTVTFTGDKWIHLNGVGVESSDWFYGPNVPPLIKGQVLYAIPPMGVSLGIWQGRDGNIELPWLRWWDTAGNLLPTADERAD